MAQDIAISNSVREFIRRLETETVKALATDMRHAVSRLEGAEAPKGHRYTVLPCGFTMLYREMAPDEVDEYRMGPGFVVVELGDFEDFQ
ncbi:hypothetical protein GCM10012280_70220 [Wenjunlia tyrosinilytica]|uniref:Uncharacterized protein n=1 Tax=Wenjunlia tyrosinilytica TaxID=1544741 RepID=A0A917ZYL2_9ACTN|nr:hypothetical protein GCM10012280_70220 [Wenjunlia tyrosinilytica]